MLLEAIEVTAPRLPPVAREDPSSAASVITRRRLEEPVTQLDEVLDEVPGLRTTDSGGFGGFSTASIRGTAAQHTDLYLDGIPLTRAASGMANLSAIPVGNVERVEVYRGSTPLAYSTSSIGGVINIVTRRPRDTELRAALGAGSFGTRTASLHAGHGGERVWSMAGVSLRTSEGNFPYLDDKGTAFDPSDDEIVQRQNNHSEQTDLLLKAGVDVTDDFHLTVTQLLYRFQGGLPGSGLRQATRAERSDLRSITSFQAEHFDWPARDWVLRAHLFYTYQQEEQQDLLAEFGLLPNDTDNRTYAPGGHLVASGPLTDWLTWGNFLAVEDERYASRDALRTVDVTPEARRRRITVASQPALRIAPLNISIIPSLRHERVSTRQTGTLEFGQPVPDPAPHDQGLNSYRLGLTFEPFDGLTFKANAARAHRVPSFTELYGTSGYVRANPRLLPETGTNLDVGLTSLQTLPNGRDHILFEAFAFHNEVEDLIQFVRATHDTMVARNFDRATLRGLEAGMQGDFFGHLALRGSYTLLRPIQHSRDVARDGKLLPLRPETQWYLRPELYHAFSGVLDRISLYVEVEHQSGNYLDAANFTAVPPRTLVGSGFQVQLLDSRLALAFKARNLADNRINDLVGFPLPGRSFFFELRGQLL